MDDFIATPTIQAFEAFKKPELLTLAQKLGLIHVKVSMRKPAIRREIAEYYYDEGVFTDDDLARFPPFVSENESELELAKLQLEREIKMKQLELEQQKEGQKRLELELEDREKQRQFELDKLKLSPAPPPGTHSDKFVASREVRLVPPFDEVKVDKYFQHFEKVAESLEWPKKYWTLMLQSVIRGKAQQTYSALSTTQAADYTVVKASILKAYELVPEAYRQKFRNLRKADNQTHVEFVHEKEVYFERWCTSRSVGADYEKLRELLLVEEFKRCTKDDIRSYLNEKEVDTLKQAAKIADEYALTHKKFIFNQKNHKPQDSKQPQGNPQSTPGREKQKEEKSSGPTCNYCRKQGHVLSDCIALKKKKEQESQAPQPQAFVLRTSSMTPSPESISRASPTHVNLHDSTPFPSDYGLRKDFLPFVTEGFISLTADSPRRPIMILRDTGASQSLLLEDTLDLKDTCNFTLVQGIEGKVVSVPLHTLYLKSPLVTGPVQIGLMARLPVKGVSLLLGNDLAGDQVVPSIQLTSKPVTDETTSDMDVFPSCAVTRALARRAREEDHVNNFTSKGDDQPLKTGHDASDAYDIDLSHFFHVSGSSENSTRNTDSNSDSGNLSLSRKQLIAEQTHDADLAHLRDKALSASDIQHVPTGYYFQDEILMRKWRPPDIAANEDWATFHQIVVPTSYRKHLLSLAHDLPLGGHFGVNKTQQKILKQFYWPGIRKDVADFCRSCHTCQMIGKRGQMNSVAPLHPIPAFGEPFSKIIIDCVGPLPKARSGNQYLLTIMCSATRFPEAIPLRNIKAKTVAKALIKFFTMVGLPEEIQSDRGSNFTSGLMQQVVYELGVKQILSSAYHPESQGALERFHSTLKTMIRAFCFDHQTDWDEGVHLLLFAAREAVQESLGFSPFELVFGHHVRGPLSLLSEQWMEKDACVSLLDYVSKFKERLHEACSLAKKNLQFSQTKMKTWYDKKARSRTFKPGDKVLVLFPLQGNPLQARFHGPYEIQTKVSNLNYVVKTPDRRKPTQLCHINMLKPYYDPSVETVSVVVDSRSHSNEDTSAEEFQDYETKIKSKIVPAKLPNFQILQDLDTKLFCYKKMNNVMLSVQLLTSPRSLTNINRTTPLLRKNC